MQVSVYTHAHMEDVTHKTQRKSMYIDHVNTLTHYVKNNVIIDLLNGKIQGKFK